MENMTSQSSNNLSYKNSNNICTPPTAYHFCKTLCEQTERATDQQTNVVTYRATIAVKKLLVYMAKPQQKFRHSTQPKISPIGHKKAKNGLTTTQSAINHPTCDQCCQEIY